jgi:hypothetical protein
MQNLELAQHTRIQNCRQVQHLLTRLHQAASRRDSIMLFSYPVSEYGKRKRQRIAPRDFVLMDRKRCCSCHGGLDERCHSQSKHSPRIRLLVQMQLMVRQTLSNDILCRIRYCTTNGFNDAAHVDQVHPRRRSTFRSVDCFLPWHYSKANRRPRCLHTARSVCASTAHPFTTATIEQVVLLGVI